ncbi:MAG TPA: hypothetical protein PKC84_06170, partial [Paracoccaceae bacterium]|nr:hypothetical protein [Paracoccaceae bacterium]
MRVVFMGTPGFAVPALSAIATAGHEVAAVYTQPPRPAGRGQQPRPSPVAQRAAELGLPLRDPVTLRDAAVQAALAATGSGWAGADTPRPFPPAPRVVAALGALRAEPLAKPPGVAATVEWAEAATLLHGQGAP